MVRKFIQFEWCKSKDQFQIGVSFCIQNSEKDLEYPEYSFAHAHIWIDLGFRCIEITFMDCDNDQLID